MILKELESAHNDYQRFVNSIRYENRFFVEEKFKKIFDSIMEECKYNISKGDILYRARMHNNEEIVKKVLPYKGKDIGMPPRNVNSSNGRVNPKGISYFYLADDKDTAIAEIRPNVDSYITIGKFITDKKLKVIKINRKMPKCINDKEKIKKDEFSREFVMIFLSNLQIDFQNSILDSEKDIKYLPMQYFTEFCKNKGYDGIMFPSSVMEQYENGRGYYNYIFFKDKDIRWIDSELIKIRQINYDVYPIK